MSRRRRGALALLCALALLGVGCTRVTTTIVSKPRPPGARGASGELYAPDPLCRRRPPPSPSPATTEQALPPAVARVAKQVEQVRGLRFDQSVVPEAVPQGQIGTLLDAYLTPDFLDEAKRVGRAYATIGAIPEGADLAAAFKAYQDTEVIGFYDPESKRLVFGGSASPTPYERVTLAHELTHALQDQHFDLTADDPLELRCRDEQLLARSAVREGDAVDTSLRWARRFLSSPEKVELGREAAQFPPPPATIPPFVLGLQLFPYVEGRAFVEGLRAEGGEQALNGAFRELPVSTEQILHPERYPSDVPQAVTVPDLTGKLGPAWSDLYMEDVGEEWLRVLLELRLSKGESEDAAAGWDGARYRAWTDGTHTAVLLDSVWDTLRDASQFAGTIRTWAGSRPVLVELAGQDVNVLFGSDGATLATLRSAAG